MLGCVALSVDIGYVYDLRGSMQSAVDASALAGASALQIAYGPPKLRAIEYASKNYLDQSKIEASELDITIGNWDGLNETFVPASESDGFTPNAIRVGGRRPEIPLFFAGILGEKSTTVNRSATAVQGGGNCLGIWGLDDVTGTGGLFTDSYDERQGAYGGANIRSNGDICSCRDMTFGGDVEIYGDTIYGEGYDLTLLGTTYEIWGMVDDEPCELTPPEFDMIGAKLTNDNSDIPDTDDGNDPLRGPGRFFLSGNDNLTLPPGKYYFSSMQIESFATVTITGPTEIYVSGNVMLGGGGIINNTQIPENLKIFCDGTTMSFTGTSDFYGAIVAPETDLNFLGTASYYGVVIGQTLDFRGTTNIHVEESLVLDLFGVEAAAPVLVQ